MEKMKGGRTAFRAPNAYELFYQSSALEVGNLKLQPETIRTAEVVVEQYAGNHYRMSGSFFQNRINRLIQQEEDVDGVLQFRNVGSVRTAGVQLVFESKWSSGLSTQVNYTYEHAADSQTGEHLGNVPAHLLNGNLLVPLVAKKLTAGLDLHYVSSRHTLAGGIAPGFVVTNLTLSSASLPGGLDLSGSIYNLFGTRYGYPGGDEHEDDILYQDGRTLRLKLSYTFGGAR